MLVLHIEQTGLGLGRRFRGLRDTASWTETAIATQIHCVRRLARRTTETAKTAFGRATTQQLADSDTYRRGDRRREAIRQSRQNSIGMVDHDAPD